MMVFWGILVGIVAVGLVLFFIPSPFGIIVLLTAEMIISVIYAVKTECRECRFHYILWALLMMAVIASELWEKFA